MDRVNLFFLLFRQWGLIIIGTAVLVLLALVNLLLPHEDHVTKQ